MFPGTCSRFFPTRLGGLLTLSCLAAGLSAQGQVQLEALNRGVVAIHGVDTNKNGTLTSTQVYVGWRLRATDPAGLAFNVYRSSGGGAAAKLNASPLTTTTDYVDTPGSFSQSLTYRVNPVIGGVEQPVEAGGSATLAANAPTQQYLTIPLTPPPGGTAPAASDGSDAGGPYTYSPADCSTGDVDGDGQYEIIVKWDPSNAKDNSQSGYTGNTFLDAYRLDGTRLWRIDLGPNIRSGAHYMDFMVFDFDGDGKAEMICRTGVGAKDSTGTYVAGAAKFQTANGARPAFNNTDDYRAINPNGDQNGYVLAGPEFLSVFDGLSGVELATVNYDPPRDPINNSEYPTAAQLNTAWGDGYGNRMDRFLAGVAYLDGQRPSAVFCRGYYTRSFLIAWDWRNGQLTRRWRFDSNTWGTAAYNGNGDHSLSVADVDADGKQEIIYGAMVIDDDGTPLHNTTLGHGDALHVGDLDPDRPGLEIFNIQERTDHQGAHFRNALTGEIYWSYPTAVGSSEGPGRAVSADIDGTRRGWECWVAGGGIGGLYDARGNKISNTAPSQTNFVVYWDDDLLCELEDSNHIDKWVPSSKSTTRLLTASGCSGNNSTKNTPCLTADLFGDWREEVIWRQSDNLALRIYSTTIKAADRRVTFMHDLQYRAAVAWQNTGYNQPAHPSYNLFEPPTVPSFKGPVRRWNAAGASGPWDTATANWKTEAGAATAFAAGDAVLFDQGGPAGTVTLGAPLQPAEVIVIAAKNYTFSGAGSVAGTTSLTKTGTGTLTLLTANSHTGGTNLAGGTVALGADSAGTELAAALGTGPVTITNAQLRLGGSSGGTYDFANDVSLDAEGVIYAVDGRQNLNGTLSIDPNSYGLLLTQFSGRDIYVQGLLQGAGRFFVDDSTSSGSSNGTVHFTNGASTFTGTLTVNASSTGRSGGRISVEHATALQDAQVENISNRSDRGLAFGVPVVEFGALKGNGAFTLPSGSLTVGGNNASTAYTGVISGAGALVKTGAGTFTLSGVNTLTGGVTVNQGTLVPVVAAQVVSASNGGMLTGGSTTVGLADTTGLVVGQAVSGTNITPGSVITAISANSSITISNPAENTAGRTLTFAAAKGLGNVGSVEVAGGTLSLGAFSMAVGSVTLTSGTISGTTGVLTGASYSVLSGTISAILGGSGGLTKSTAGTVILSGVNTFTGPTAIGEGTLTVGVNGAVPDVSAVAIAAGATLNLNGKTETIGGLSGAGAVTLGGGPLTVNATGPATFTGGISGAGTFSKIGASTQTLGGASTYTGATTVAAGTLAVSGSLTNASTLEVLSGATLDLTGTLTVSTVTIRAGGTLTGNGTINGTLLVEGLGALSTGLGTKLRVVGNVTNNGTVRLTNGTALDVTGTFTNNGTLDLLTGSRQLPANFSNHGLVIDASAARVGNVQVSGANLQVIIQSYAGHNYQLQRSPTLNPVAWDDLGPAQAGNGGALTFSDTLGATGTQGFYRVTISP